MIKRAAGIKRITQRHRGRRVGRWREFDLGVRMLVEKWGGVKEQNKNDEKRRKTPDP
jgi:hypothetical protein